MNRDEIGDRYDEERSNGDWGWRKALFFTAGGLVLLALFSVWAGTNPGLGGGAPVTETTPRRDFYTHERTDLHARTACSIWVESTRAFSENLIARDDLVRDMNSAQRIGVKSDTASIRHAAGQIWTGGDVEIQSHRYGAGWMAFGLACAKAGL